MTNSGRIPKTNFAIDTQAGTVTCPAGVTTTEAKKAKDHKGRPGLRFSFPAATRATCPLREQCVGGAKGRSIFVGRHHDRIAAARAAPAEGPTKALLRQRSKIERNIDHLQDLGMREARYRDRRKDASAGAARGHGGQPQAPRCARGTHPGRRRPLGGGSSAPEVTPWSRPVAHPTSLSGLSSMSASMPLPPPPTARAVRALTLGLPLRILLGRLMVVSWLAAPAWAVREQWARLIWAGQ